MKVFMPQVKSWVNAYPNSTQQNITKAPLKVVADMFSSCEQVYVTAQVTDGKKLTYTAMVSGQVSDGDGQNNTVYCTVLKNDGSVMEFGELDKLVSLVKTAFASTINLTIQVSGVSTVRGNLRLSGDPAAAQARALLAITKVRDDVAIELAKQAADISDIAYYANGNAVEIAYYNRKLQQKDNVEAFNAWALAEYTRLGGV